MTVRPLEIDVRSLARGPNTLEVDASAAELGIAPEELTLEGPVTATLDLFRTDDMVHVKGRVSGVALETCGLCAGPARRTFVIDLTFVAKEALAGQENEEDPGDEDLLYYAHDVLDLTEPIRQLVLLAAPMVPRCEEACRGLCPICGTNLNLATCSCEVVTKDPRWDKLSQMLEKPPSSQTH